MPRTERFAERIGKVFLPEADAIETTQDFTPNPEGPVPIPGIPIPFPEEPRLPLRWPPERIDFPYFKLCRTTLKPGCYTLGFTPSGTSIFGTRFRGTLRVEALADRPRISGDLYTYRLLDDIIIDWPLTTASALAARGAFVRDEAEDSGGTIPIYRRTKYHSYLKGTGAQLVRIVPKWQPCSFTLSFDEFVYNHPATGFSGSFNSTKTRSIQFVLRHTATPDVYSGEAYDGSTLLGTVSIRWISDFFRRAHLRINTLQGAETPPAAVGAATFATIFADAGWDLTVTDGGTVPLPGALGGININACWSSADLHTLMSSVPSYNAADLDSVWRVHLVAVPATLGCSRGVMFDILAADPNDIAREGSATFSRDGYPAGDCPDGMGGSHYDAVANQQQRNVPRAFLRSATHEVGHAFNQIHQGFEAGNDNSIMTPTPSVATVLGIPGIFPDGINLGFNDTVKRHLRHLPDPAVRPGAMDFFGSAVSAPEASDVAWLESVDVAINVSSDHVSLGEPVSLSVSLRNRGPGPVPAPETLDAESLTLRINVTDPTGRITFMRPANVLSCPRLTLKELAPGQSRAVSTTLFWGREGFAFETPGRHVVEAIVLWSIAGVPVAASGERAIFVAYPVSRTDNEVAALLLDPDVGRAVASGNVWAFERAANRIRQVMTAGRGHPSVRALTRMGLLARAPARRRSRSRARTRSRRRRT